MPLLFCPANIYISTNLHIGLVLYLWPSAMNNPKAFWRKSFVGSCTHLPPSTAQNTTPKEIEFYMNTKHF